MVEPNDAVEPAAQQATSADGFFRSDRDGSKFLIRVDQVSAVVSGGLNGLHYAIVAGNKIDLDEEAVAEELIAAMKPKPRRRRPRGDEIRYAGQ